MTKPLKQLCEEIEKYYEGGLTMFDSPLAEHIQELADRTDEIKAMLNVVDCAIAWYNTGIGKPEKRHELEMATMRHLKGQG